MIKDTGLLGDVLEAGLKLAESGEHMTKELSKALKQERIKSYHQRKRIMTRKDEIELSILDCIKQRNAVETELDASYSNYRKTGVGTDPEWLAEKRAKYRSLSLELARLNFVLRKEAQARKESETRKKEAQNDKPKVEPINPVAVAKLSDALAEPQVLRTRLEAQKDFAKLVQRRKEVQSEIDAIRLAGGESGEIEALRQEYRALGTEIRLAQKEDEIIAKREKAERAKSFERQDHLLWCFHRQAKKVLPAFVYNRIGKAAGFTEKDFAGMDVRERTKSAS